ncbi:MAG: hypothetical protein Q8O22_05470 [Candidatus Omnitrophota bacterium]|nr:hypothetical protein [Candidatus Omnitrophota bacterium]
MRARGVKIRLLNTVVAGSPESIGQSIAEYLIIMCIVLAAILASGLLGKMRTAFNGYFTGAATAITEVANP